MTVQVVGRRERKKQAVRDKICAETISLISAQGLEGTTVDAISEAADIAKKTFYNYFSSRNELLLEVSNEHVLKPTELLVNKALANGGSFPDQLTFVVKGLKSSYTSADSFQREMIDFMVTYFSAQRNHGINHIEFMNRCYLKLFKANVESLKPNLSPAFCAEMMVAVMTGVTINWLNMEGYDVDASMERVLAFLLESMQK